ncbi:MAG: 4-hydroxythreonine-4-phosphate dehydrogenase PdxA [Pseudomonadota bacterium]
MAGTGLPLALSLGDPAGIGPEIAVAARASGRITQPFFAIGDGRALGESAVPIADPAETAQAWQYGVPVLERPCPAPIVPGHPDTANAHAVIDWIETAVGLVHAGKALALVTNPIAKKVLYDGAGFSHPGHTEFLGALAGGVQPVMMIAGPNLRVVPVTIHIPLTEVPRALTVDLIVETARITAEGLRRDFAIPAPRLAIAGLNPHAGEGGAMGREEIETITPAVERLCALGLDVTGPLPADTMFHVEARRGYDVALTMYHDQGLVPVKALDFDEGVNVTLGLPFVRTSPDHGTAFAIAGQAKARSDSLIAALNMAARMGAARAGQAPALV